VARRPRPAERPFPTRDEILAFIAEHPGRAGARDIARAFSIKGTAQRIALRTLLTELTQEGAVARDHGRLKRPGDLPSVAVLTVSGRDRDGELLAEPVEWPEEQPPPKIVVSPTRKRGVPAPGPGDRILARLSPGGDGVDLVAEIIRVLAAAPDTVLGVVRRGEREARLEPISRKERSSSSTTPAPPARATWCG
jgi:ribonuclease R